MLIVVLSWIFVSAFGALPYLLGHVFNNFTDAFFETLSGFTATGSTVLQDIDSLPRSILFWRSETHWLGGMGIVVLGIAIFPSLAGNKTLFSSEAPVSFMDEELFPRIAVIAKSYWNVYLLFTVVEALLLLPVMGWFDAVTHAFATIAGGGFSTHNASIAYFDSVYVEVVVMVFMIAGATSFILHYRALQGKFLYFKNSTFRLFMWITVTATLLIALNLYLTGGPGHNIWHDLRLAAFNVVSLITTTGFAIADFKYWPSFSVLVLIILMFIGGMPASTSGSVKVTRYQIIYYNLKSLLKGFFHRTAVTRIWKNGRAIDEELILTTQMFVLTYILIFVVSGLLLVAFGNNPATSFSAVAATLGNVGPGIGAVGPYDNFSGLSAIVKWILSCDMLLGRLEIWTFLTLIIPEFWGIK